MLGSNVINLLFTASGNTENAQQAFNELSESIQNDSQNIQENVESGAGGAGSAFSSLTDVAGLAAVGIAAVAAAAVAVAGTLFGLTNAVAEANTEIANFQNQTGLAAENISTIKTASEQAGSSLGEFEEVWESFIETLIEGGKGADDAKEKLKAAGIDPQKGFKDLDGSVIKAFEAIRKAGTQAEKSAIAMQVFGESGLSMVKVASEMTGGFDAYKKKLTEMGLTVDESGIKKSKEYDRQLKEMQLQISAVGEVIGMEFMPIFLDMAKSTSAFFKNNQTEVKTWANNSANAVKGLAEYWKDLNNSVAKYKLQSESPPEGGWAEYFRKIDEFFLGKEGVETLKRNPLNNVLGRVGQDVAGKIIQRGALLGQTIGDLRRSDDTNNKPNFTPTDTAKEKEAAENRRKTREEALKKEIADLAKYNSLKIEGERLAFEIEQKNLETALENKQKTIDQYAADVKENLDKFSTNVANLMMSGFQLDIKGKKGQELANISEAYGNAQMKFGAEIDRQRETLLAKQTETTKKENEKGLQLTIKEIERKIELKKQETQQSIKNAELEFAQKLITEKQFIAKSDDLKYQSAVFERAIYQSLIKENKLSAEQKLEFYKKIADISAQIDLDFTDQTTRNVKLITETQKQALEDYLELKRQIVEAERETQDVLNGETRKKIVDDVEKSTGKAKIKALTVLRDFDIAEAERRAEQRQDDLAAELEAVLERIKGKEFEEAEKEKIIQLYREKALISEAEFEARRAEINSQNEGKQADEKSWSERFFDTFAAGVGGYLENVALIRGANGELQFSMGAVFDTIGKLGTDAFSALAEGFGSMVESWVLYGNTGGMTLRKLAAQILSNLAGIATQYAIMCLAAAAFATTVFGAAILGGTPAQFLVAAAIFGSIAVGTALLGRAVAGDSFSKQNSGAFGTAAAKENGGKREGASDSGVYSGNRDTLILDMARNIATKGQNVNIKIEDNSSMGFGQFFRVEVQKNGDARAAIRQVIADD